MKTTLLLTLHTFFAAVVGSAAYSTRAAPNPDEFVANPAKAFELPNNSPGDAFLDVSNQEVATYQRQDATAYQHENLLARFRTEERMTAQARSSLESQQRMLGMLQQREEALLARTRASESSEAAFPEEPIITHTGVKVINEASDTHRFATVRTAIDVEETENQFWDRQNKQFYRNVIAICFYMLSISIVGFFYMNCIEKFVGPKLPESMIRSDEFQYGAFECSDMGRDWYICLCAVCFEWVRWADTASHPQIDVLAFWPALFITSLLAATASITYGLSLLILLLVAVYCRQRIRLAHGLPSGSCSVLAADCCLWTCCPCCAIVQEARQVEYVESKLVPFYDDTPGGQYPGSASTMPYPNSAASLASA